jgi:glycerol-3-phosphate dehydrogenase
MVSYLASIYGSKFSKVLEYAERGARGRQPLCLHAGDITAQIWYAVAEESTYTVSDFIMRRSGLGLAECQGLDAVEIVGREMGKLLGWSPEEQQRQVNEYKKTAALAQKYRY